MSWRVPEADGIRIADAAGLHGEMRHRVLGRLFDYPECCIDQFVADQRVGVLSATLRGATAGGWVPCDRCVSEPAFHGVLRGPDLCVCATAGPPS